MVPVIIKTDGRLAAADRFVQYKQQVLARQAVPVKLHIDRPEGFAAKLTVRAAGVVDLATLSTHSCVPSLAERTPKLIRQSDPEAYRLIVNVSGESQAAHGEHDVELGPGDMALYDTSLPFRVWRGAVNGGSGTNTWAMATFSRTLLQAMLAHAYKTLICGRCWKTRGSATCWRSRVTRGCASTVLVCRWPTSSAPRRPGTLRLSLLSSVLRRTIEAP